MSTLPESPPASEVAVREKEACTAAENGKDPARASARPIKIIRPPTFSLRTILAGLRTLVQYSDLLYTLSLFRLNVRYKQSLLGWAWAAVQPLALMGVYTVIFTRVATVAT